MNSNEIYSKTADATKWSSLTEIFSKLILPITNMILARLLTPEAFGVVATVTMITSFADIFTDAGFQKYLIQHDFKDQDELDQHTNVAFWTNLGISLLLWVLISVFSVPLAVLVGNPGLERVIVLASLSVPMTAFCSIQIARFKREFDFKTLFYIKTITCLVPLVVTVPLAFATRSFWALVIGTLALNLANTIVLTVKSKWKPKLYYSFQALKSMFSYSWWILLESISIWLTSYVGTFIVGLSLSTYYLGLYKTSMSTVNQIFSLITVATSMPLFVSLCRTKNDEKQMMQIYRDYTQSIGVWVVPLGIGVFLYRDFITGILLGSQWQEASNFVGLWGLMSSVSLVFGTYCNGYFNAKGKTKISFFAQIIHLLFLIPSIMITAGKGYEILCLARSLVRLELVIGNMVIMKFVFKFPIGKLFADSLPVFISAACMALIDGLIHNLFDHIFWHILCIVICVVVYFSALFFINKKLIQKSLQTFGIVKMKNEASQEGGL